MKNLKNSFIVKFVGSLFLISVLIGIIFFFTYKPDLGTSLNDFKNLIDVTRQNTFLSNIISISSIFILSASIIGAPIIVLYIFYEGLSIGFTLAVFLFNYKIKGLIFYCLFFFISKFLFTIITLYFAVLSIKFVIKVLDSLVSKNKEEFYKTIVYQFYRFLIVILFVLVNSAIVYFFSNKIISLFINLI